MTPFETIMIILTFAEILIAVIVLLTKNACVHEYMYRE